MQEQGKFLYLCLQAESEHTIAEGYNTGIMAIVDYEELAQEICRHHGDSYMVFDKNKDYGREIMDGNLLAVWNENGKFLDYEGNDRTIV